MSLESYINELARKEFARRAQKIEDQLLDHDVVAVPYFDEFIIYRVPGWREAPIRRAKIAVYRWKRKRLLKRKLV